jgi:hypothetical protein
MTTRISQRVPQLSDDVLVKVTLPATVEDSLDKLLLKSNLKDYPGFTVKRVKRTGELEIICIIGGNCDAVDNSVNVLQQIQEAAREGNVSPLNLTLSANAMATAKREPTKKKKPKKKLKIK